MRILGIDPGNRCGMALLDGEHTEVRDGPTTGTDRRQLDPAGVAAVIRAWGPDIAVIERVGPAPRQGVAATFQFGFAAGVLRGVCAALALPVELVTPATWKRFYRLGPDKEAARALALRLYPALAADLARKGDTDRAEALLIARWYLETGARHG